MPEKGPVNEHEASQGRREFDSSQFPDVVSGFAMPAPEDSVEVEIVDST